MKAVRETPTATELEALFSRIRDTQASFNAFLALTDELAERDLARVHRDAPRNLPLAGMTIAVKDNIDVAGVSTTAASPLYASRVARRDAVVVRRLRRAGAVIVGKTNMHELAYGATTVNPPPFGATRNAWDRDRSPGGSSGGSAVAVAMDLVDAALGSDTGGSVRIPAALSGVTGLRPTSGRVSGTGVIPLGRSFDIVGPIARTAADVARVLGVIAGYDPGDVWSMRGRPRRRHWQPSGSLSGLRLGLPGRTFFDGVLPAIESSLLAAATTLEGLGASVVETDLSFDIGLWEHPSRIVRAEAYATYGDAAQRTPHLFSAELHERLAVAGRVRGWEVAEAIAAQREWRRRLDTLFLEIDILLCPATRILAPLISADPIATSSELTRLMYPWSFGGVPALTMPGGSSDGLPIGVQLVGPPWADEDVLDVAIAFQAATPWHLARPDPCHVQ